jgi:hypothetical protein
LSYFKLNPNTKVIFDNDFGYESLDLKNIDKKLIIEIKPLENKYTYIYKVYRDKKVFFTSNSTNKTKVDLVISQPGSYTTECDMYDISGNFETAYSSDTIKYEK